VTGAARLLGVHVNTVRAWTDQGRLRCLRMNARGDRRYSTTEIERFLAQASRLPPTGGSSAPAESGKPIVTTSPSLSSSSLNVAVLTGQIAQATSASAVLEDVLLRTAGLLGDYGYDAAAFVGNDGAARALKGALEIDRRLCASARRRNAPVRGAVRRQPRVRSVALPVGTQERPAGVLQLQRAEPGPLAATQETEMLALVSAQLDAAVAAGARLQALDQQRRRAEMLHAVSSDISSQLDLARILNRLLDYSTELFGADHAAVFRRLPTGSFTVDLARDLSPEFCQALEHAPILPLTRQAFEEGRIVSASDYPEDSRGASLRHAMLREGVNTVTVAPLISDGQLLGALAIYHDQPYTWGPEDLALLEQFASMGAVAAKNARNYSQMATWAAQLQSIQQLGARLTRLSTVHDIGQAIASELDQLIDYHNVRVYRIEGDEVAPVAWRGDIGEYTTEDSKQLRVKVGQGITGWVARHGIAQNLGDAASDRRTETIPGTDDGLEESLLLAPMLYEDEVMGVIVLAKLGLHQFTSDDLRLLEIYASIAAQAMANADVSEQLRSQSETLARQLQSQSELLRVTESILGTLDTQDLLDEIAVRLASLLHVDNVGVDLHDPQAGVFRPLFARGTHADEYLASNLREDEGIAGHVLRTGEAELVQDELRDERVVHFSITSPQQGALIVAPLRERDRVSGLLTIERLGEGAQFSAEEFELVKLFAGHVSIALQNAQTHRAVEIKAETDPLTGLKNHGALNDYLVRAVTRGEPFALLMVDLDGFKAYNDAKGHEAGNVMLKQVARVLRDACRHADEVFRYGGDEFAIVLPNESQAGALLVAEKVRQSVRKAAPSRPVRVTSSIGVATYPDDAHDRGSILLAADRACYAAKRKGRDRAATAADGLLLAADLEPVPAPIDSVEASYSAA
jgi:diguanylate cyclase (GGDEF)-like protein/excisionase family DNA binding protein